MFIAIILIIAGVVDYDTGAESITALTIVLPFMGGILFLWSIYSMLFSTEKSVAIIGPEGIDIPVLGSFKWAEIDYISKIFISYSDTAVAAHSMDLAQAGFNTNKDGCRIYYLLHLLNQDRYKAGFFRSLDPTAMMEQFKFSVGSLSQQETKLFEDEIEKYKSLSVERSVRYIQRRGKTRSNSRF